MKKMKLVLPLFLLSLSALAGCGKKEVTYYSKDQFVPMDVTFSSSGNYTIGILLPVTHAALDAAVLGFKSELDNLGWESGTNITFQELNAMGDASLLSSYADNLIANCDMVLGVGTGAAQKLKSAQFNAGSKKPILFTAVTDAVSADLVHTNDAPGGFVTGASDAQPVEAQIDLIKECIPSVTSIGVLYTQTEENSRVQAAQASAEISRIKLNAVSASCSSKLDISSATSSLISSGVQAIYLPTDNNIASSMENVMSVANDEGVLVMCGEEGMVTSGGHVTLSIDYNELGKRTGEIANTILNGGVSPNQISVVTMKTEDCELVKSSMHLAQAQITLDSAVLLKPWKDVDAD